MAGKSRVKYHEETDLKNTLLLRQTLTEMPTFVKDYFLGKENISTNTSIKYAYDFRTFFQFMISSNPVFKDYAVKDFKSEDLERITPHDIDEYKAYLRAYESPNVNNESNSSCVNKTPGIKRKCASLRSLFNWLYKREYINNNPMMKVELPRENFESHEIIRLDEGEVALLLEHVEHFGDTLSAHQKVYYEKTRLRDIAIVTLLLGTGMRVSECVGIDLEDISFFDGSILVHRKEGKEMRLYFGEEVEEALKNYLKEREGITPLSGHEHALFLSSQRKRIGVRAIETMIEKYTESLGLNKHITPHKLRSTFGTLLYRETGDLYTVSATLGHSSPNVTAKYYAASDEERRRAAARAHRLKS